MRAKGMSEEVRNYHQLSKSQCEQVTVSIIKVSECPCKGPLMDATGKDD